jgi:hypothetical protein
LEYPVTITIPPVNILISGYPVNIGLPEIAMLVIIFLHLKWSDESDFKWALCESAAILGVLWWGGFFA